MTLFGDVETLSRSLAGAVAHATERASVSIPLAMLQSGYSRVTTGRTKDGERVVFVNGKRVDEWLEQR